MRPCGGQKPLHHPFLLLLFPSTPDESWQCLHGFRFTIALIILEYPKILISIIDGQVRAIGPGDRMDKSDAVNVGFLAAVIIILVAAFIYVNVAG